MGNLGDGRDINHLQRRVRHRFEEHGLRPRRHRRAPLVKIGAIDEHHLHPEAPQHLFEDVEAGPEQRARDTTWSPARSIDTSAPFTAAMPLAVAKASSVPSMAAIRSSNIRVVGLP